MIKWAVKFFFTGITKKSQNCFFHLNNLKQFDKKFLVKWGKCIIYKLIYCIHWLHFQVPAQIHKMVLKSATLRYLGPQNYTAPVSQYVFMSVPTFSTIEDSRDQILHENKDHLLVQYSPLETAHCKLARKKLENKIEKTFFLNWKNWNFFEIGNFF